MDDLAATGGARTLTGTAAINLSGRTAREAGLVACRGCGTLDRLEERRCTVCGEALHSRRPQSLQVVWAWLIAGMIMYVPANVLPMLLTRSFGGARESTIIGGAFELASSGAWGVALIVFIASVVIPVGKFIVIGRLAMGVTHGSARSAKRRIWYYEIVEFIGRWSMIDVFVVAILSALVQLGFVASINPGPAAVCFALSVMFTMFAAQAFDPRLIWDTYAPDTGDASHNA